MIDLALSLTDAEYLELVTATLEYETLGSPHRVYRKIFDAYDNPDPQGGAVRQIVTDWTVLPAQTSEIVFTVSSLGAYENLSIEVLGASLSGNNDLRVGVRDASDALLNFFSAGATFGGVNNWMDSTERGLGTYNYLRLDVPRLEQGAEYVTMSYVLLGRRRGYDAQQFNESVAIESIVVYLLNAEFDSATRYRVSADA